MHAKLSKFPNSTNALPQSPMKLLTLALLATVGLGADTTAAPLIKRYQKVRLPKTTTTSTTQETPKPWVRTIYDDVVEIVTPTVMAGVTFYAKPPANTDAPHPWISLDKNGSPKTIKPELKNGITKNASPTYGTAFQTATTVVYNYDDLKAHNMQPDEVHEEVEWADEDKTYVSLNPLIRCTPERFRLQGIARDKSSGPFCTPHENAQLVMGNTYFFTWYTKFFSDEYVRLHFSYVKEKTMDKGMSKRSVDTAFFSTPWIENLHGFYDFSIQEEWLRDEWKQNVAVSIQPRSIEDDEFDLLTNATVFKIQRKSTVGKNSKEDRARMDAGITDDTWYYVMLSIPSVICLTGIGMYIFLLITKGERDFSAVRRKAVRSKHRILGKFKGTKNKRYSELPQFEKGGLKHA